MENNSRLKGVRIFIQNNPVQKEHFHQDMELLYVLEGTLDVSYGENKVHMGTGDVFVVNAGKFHGLTGSEKVLYLSMMIDYQMLTEMMKTTDVIFWCDSTTSSSERYDELRLILRFLLKHYLETHGDTENFGHYGLCYRVLDILVMYFLVHKADLPVDDGDRYEERLLQINSYIQANYDQPISLKDLADKMYLSNGYLSRFFKKNFGMNFAEYLTEVRLHHAMDELLSTSTPITRIAFNCGFASMAIFNKAFKKAYGSTPSEVRKREKGPQTDGESAEREKALEEQLERVLVLQEPVKDEADETKVLQGTFDVRENQEIQNFWGRLINIGTASDLLKSEVREHVVLLRESLGFTWVRFWNLFSWNMLLDGQESGDNFNFTRLDSILDFLLQHGMKPHFEMGMKPWKIIRNVAASVVEEVENPDFVGSERWEALMDAMMRHLVRRYGQQRMEGWRMELWFNEGQWDDKTTWVPYFRTFQKTRSIVKRHCEGVEVGGCGLRLDFGQEDLLQFLQTWAKKTDRPDFISVILYPYDRGELRQDKLSKRSTDDAFMLHGITQANKLLQDAGLGRETGMKLYITEWNLTVSDRNCMNDTCFKGAYIIRNVLDMWEMADDMGYFVGSDRTSEHHDSGEVLHGGAAFLTRDGILKPAGFAFDFLRRLYPRFVARGSNYLISTDEHDAYGIVCHNQMPLSYNYYFTKEDEIERDHLWKYYERRSPLEMDLSLTGLTDGVYQVKTYCVNENNGSVLTIWKEMEWEHELSLNDVRYLQRMCEPRLTIQKIETQDGTLTLHIRMQPNEIAFLRLRLT